MNNNDNFEVIHSYSRKQAIDDGFLVDVTHWATPLGYKYQVAFTATLWAVIEAIPECSWQDISGRVHDVLFMGIIAIKKLKKNESFVSFNVIINTQNEKIQSHRLVMNLAPGDTPEPVFTVGFLEDF